MTQLWKSACAKYLQSFMEQIAEILHRNLGVEKRRVRAYVEDNEHPENFCIDGKLKDFSKKVT